MGNKKVIQRGGLHTEGIQQLQSSDSIGCPSTISKLLKVAHRKPAAEEANQEELNLIWRRGAIYKAFVLGKP